MLKIEPGSARLLVGDGASTLLPAPELATLCIHSKPSSSVLHKDGHSPRQVKENDLYFLSLFSINRQKSSQTVESGPTQHLRAGCLTDSAKPTCGQQGQPSSLSQTMNGITIKPLAAAPSPSLGSSSPATLILSNTGRPSQSADFSRFKKPSAIESKIL